MELNRIYNIDCTEGMKMLPKDQKYIVVTDPPFNVGYHYKSYSDNMPEDEYYKWLCDIIGSNPAVIVHYPESLYKYSAKSGIAPNRVVSWVYNSNTTRQHRDIAFFGVTPDFCKVKQPYKNLSDKRIIERMQNGERGGKLYDWIYCDQTKNVSKRAIKGVVHPCQMPVSLMKKIVAILPEDYVIVDPFMGSGTTALACIECKRQYVGFEIDSDYYNIANERIKLETMQLKLF